MYNSKKEGENVASYSGKVTASKLNVRKSASTSSSIVKKYKKGQKITITQIKNTSSQKWGKTKDGWVCLKSGRSSYVSYSKAKAGSGKKGGKKDDKKQAKIRYNKLYDTLKNSVNNGGKLNKTMQLFGLPYQFLPSVDYRVENVSDELGRKFIQNIVLDAPVATILPGEPSYLPGEKDKTAWTNAFIKAANGNFGELQALAGTKKGTSDVKFYDFKTAYIEYMQYVNILCRTCATFLELNGKKYQINGKGANFLTYDWKDYRWNGQKYKSTSGQVATRAAKSVKSAAKSMYNTLKDAGTAAFNFVTRNSTSGSKKNKISVNDNSSKMSDEEKGTLEDLFRNVHFVQFYVDPDSGVSESMSNSTTQSSLKGAFDTASSSVKEVAFMANSGGVDAKSLQNLGDSMISSLGSALGTGVGALNSQAGTLVNRLLSTSSNIIKGENVIMPDIYSGSSYTKSYTLNIHLKALYGNKYSVYMDVLVPLMHLLALVLPKATTANTFAAPFLVKFYIPGICTCNMGIVESIQITKPSTTEAYNMDGLPTEMDVTLNIADLYSDLSMTPSNNPVLFVNNSSLVEYLGTTCGLNLIDSQFSTKVSNLWNNIKNAVTDIPDNAISKVTEAMDEAIYSFTGL